MKTKLLFVFLALFSLNAFALISEDDGGQDGNGNDYRITDYEKRLCKYVQTEMKDSESYVIIAEWGGKTQELSKLDIETKCCEINPKKCEQPKEPTGPIYAGEK